MADAVSGVARVSDGDTVHIAGQSIRLHGIDAPETGQDCLRANGEVFACGKWATRQLRRMVEGKVLTCTGSEHDRYNRLVAKCFLDGQDIAIPLVDQGIVIAYRKYSMDYVGVEKGAAIAARGLWSMKFQEPGTWRIKGSLADAQRACAIKGNITKNGHIYHMPGQPYYGVTRIDEARGERWFCTQSEARQAGWRPARN